MTNNEPSHIHQTKAQIFFRFLRFGLLAWGGPVAQIAMIRQELVEEEKWVSKEKFNRVLTVYQVLPGPEAHEMCVYFGMMAGGRWGGILAGLGFMLPGLILMLVLTWFYVQFGIQSPLLQSVFIGFQVAVIALIVRAVHRIGKHALVNLRLFIIAIVGLIAFICGIHFLIVLAICGMAYVWWMQEKKVLLVLLAIVLSAACMYFFNADVPGFNQQDIDVGANLQTEKHSLWLVLLSGLKGGLLTFGGAYTAIPFIQQDALQYGWMTNQQFLDGIALSGILPAPLIIFTTFVGYFGGGWIGSIIMTVAIFLPAFLFTLIGHSVMERLIQNTSLHHFLDGIAAGVIGLITLTAIQLCFATVTSLFAALLFAAVIFFLYKISSKLSVVYAILSAGLISLIYFQIA